MRISKFHNKQLVGINIDLLENNWTKRAVLKDIARKGKNEYQVSFIIKMSNSYAYILESDNSFTIWKEELLYAAGNRYRIKGV